ncbi:MAG: 2-isopropylmalate synthase, partial [Paenibacillus sp.]|nr:2-isopropylmalate synthase [Paenibacillus sp.]
LALADAKKEVYDHDVFYLVTNHRNLDAGDSHLYELASFQVVSNDLHPTATVCLRKGSETTEGSAVGDGPIDALYSVIKTLAGLDVQLKDYKINSLSRGKEAIGRVNIRLEHDGKVFSGRAMDTDIIKASAQAFLNGINAAVLDAAK